MVMPTIFQKIFQTIKQSPLINHGLDVLFTPPNRGHKDEQISIDEYFAKHFQNITHDIGMYICSFLSISDIVHSISLISKHWNQISNSDILWEILVSQLWIENNKHNITNCTVHKQIMNSSQYSIYLTRFLQQVDAEFSTEYMSQLQYSCKWKQIFKNLHSIFFDETVATTTATTTVDEDNEPRGLFHYLGRYLSLNQKLKQHHLRYTNPASISFIENETTNSILQIRLNRIDIKSSGNKVGKNHSFINRKLSANWTENSKYAYFMIDLGKYTKFSCNRYRMRYGSKNYKVLPKSWKLEASNDANEWFTLRNHIDDTTSFPKVDYSPCSWEITTQTCPSHFGKLFRYFRLMLTDKTASKHPDWQYVLVVTCFEMFGVLHVNQIEYDQFERKCIANHVYECIAAIYSRKPMEQVVSLIEKCDIPSIDAPITLFGENLLHLASMYDYLELVKYLIQQRNANVMCKTDQSKTAYELAATQVIKDYIHNAQIEFLYQLIMQCAK